MRFSITEEIYGADKLPLNIERTEYIARVVVPQIRQKFAEFVADHADISLDGDTITISLDTDEDLKKELKLCQYHGMVTYEALQLYRERVSHFESLSIWGLIKLALKR